MAANEWDTERLYVLEMLKETRSGLREQGIMIQDFKLETAKSITEIKTKLSMQVSILSFVIATVVSIASKFLG